MADLLSHSKRKFIESWRQKVCQYMENGNICRVVVGEMTPEPDNGRFSKHSFDDPNRGMGFRSPPPPNDFHPPNEHLPAVKFVYSHGDEHQDRVDINNNRNRYLKASTKRRRRNNTEFHDIRSGTMYIENSLSPVELPDLNDSVASQRKSSKIAKELYEKYNLKSEKHRFPSATHKENGMHVYSMPWRNKTFLTLPLRFNSDYQNTPRLSRQRSNFTRMKADVRSRGSNDLDEIDW